MDDAIVGAFLEWLTGQLRQPSCGDASVEVATGALGGLLRSRSVRSQYALNVPLLVRAFYLRAACKSVSAATEHIRYCRRMLARAASHCANSQAQTQFT